MKKVLTVLLVIAVMFTFSFGSAFAQATGTYVDTKAEAVKKITDKADGYVADINTDLAKVISEYSSYAWKDNVSKTAYTNVVTKTAEDAISAMQTKKVQALNALETAEKTAAAANNDVILGYVVESGTVDAGYVDVYTILNTITDPDFATTNFADPKYDTVFLEEEFDLVKKDTVDAINAIDLSVYSTTADSDNDGVKDYDEAVEAKRVALVAINAIKLETGDNSTAMLGHIRDIKAVFHVDYKGTADEAFAGTLGDALNALKKTTVEVTDAKMADYAKTNILSMVKPVIETAKSDLIKVEKEKILAQELSAKPDQKKIAAAEDKIAEITEQYDAMLEVWTYRIENAEYKIEASGNVNYVNVYYDDAYFAGKIATHANVGSFASNVWSGADIYADGVVTIAELNDILNASQALAIAKAVDDLQEDAALLKASIEVDGNTYIEIDEALADAVDETYMTGNLKVALDTTTVNTATHERIHDLLGADGKKVTVDGKKYKTVYAWDDTLSAYDETKADEVEALVDATVDALKECKSVAEADAAFLAAYDKFDAIMTDAEHDAMFVYGGELYDAYTKAVAEVNAYVGYKADLMGDTFPGNVNTLKAYFTGGNDVGVLWDDVYSAADLDAAVADAKATIDSLKTKKELKDEDATLAKKVLAVVVPVTLDAKADIVALYKEVVDFNDYLDMVGYTGARTADKNGLIKTYVQNLADLEEDAIKEMKKAIDKDGKITLDEKAAVDELAAAVDAYNELYVEDLETEQTEQDSESYENAIFMLEVKAAEELIAALPVNATVAQVAAAQDAVDALGFDGICVINKTLLTKLNKFTQDAEYAAINAVETLKITAKSTAKKGSITVKWTVKGEAAVADGYQVWKSTKQSKGYKKAFTTTKQSYKNTKGLKAGTRYYYKVRAYKVVDGKNVYSDWSNKAYRVAK